MLPLVDIHCHLLAGLDDGPRTDEEALAMCQLAYPGGYAADLRRRSPERTLQ